MAMTFRDFQFSPKTMVNGLLASPVVIRSVAWAIASFVLAWVLANWFWDIARPDAPPVVEASLQTDHVSAAAAIASRHLMGRGSSESDGTEPGGSTVDWKLTGAMTASPGVAGFAILSRDGKPPIAALEGEEIAPGVTLQEVLPGRVKIKNGAQGSTLEMTTKTSNSPPATPRSEQPRP